MSALPSFISSGSRVVGHTTPVSPLVASIHRGLTKTPRPFDRKGRLFASDSAFCARQGVIKSRTLSDSIESPSFYGYTKVGETMEDIVVTGLHLDETLLFKQFRLFAVDGLNLGGKIDAIVYVEGKVYAVEVKSCGELPKSATERGYQASQAALYSVITGLPGKLLYFSRTVANQQGDLKMVDFDISTEQSHLALWTIMYAQYANEIGAVPDVPSHITGPSKCGFCPYKKSCFGEDKQPLPMTRELHHVTPDEHIMLVEKVGQFVAKFTSPEETRVRRNGVLSHIMANNTIAARVLADKNWDDLVR